MIFRRKIFCHGTAFSPKRAGSRLHGLLNMAAPVGPRPSVSFGPKNSLQPIAWERCPSVCRWLVPSSTHLVRRSRKPNSSPVSCRAMTGGVRDIRNPALVPTLHRCAPKPFVTVIIMSSMDRKPGQRWRNMPTGASSWFAPIQMPRRKRASASC